MPEDLAFNLAHIWGQTDLPETREASRYYLYILLVTQTKSPVSTWKELSHMSDTPAFVAAT